MHDVSDDDGTFPSKRRLKKEGIQRSTFIIQGVIKAGRIIDVVVIHQVNTTTTMSTMSRSRVADSLPASFHSQDLLVVVDAADDAIVVTIIRHGMGRFGVTCEALDWGLGKVSGLLLFLNPDLIN